MKGSKLKYSKIVVILRACADGQVNTLERNFLQSLGEFNKYELEGDTLRLFVKNKPSNIIFPVKPQNLESKTANVKEKVLYLPRIALAPNAVIKVQLHDVSKAGAKSEIIAVNTFPVDKKPVKIESKIVESTVLIKIVLLFHYF